MHLDRRKFIKTTSLASLSLVLAHATGIDPEDLDKSFEFNFNADFQFHVADNNLLNLHFYFINIIREGKKIVPKEYAKRSFMIVRLPQQHVSEKGFWEEDWSSQTKKTYPDAKLSGYSYLAFELFPDILGKNNELRFRERRRMEFKLENLLNWNDSYNFSLITLVEWFYLKDPKNNSRKTTLDFRDYQKKCEDFKTHKVWNKTSVQTGVEMKDDYYVHYENEPKKSAIYKKYKSIVRNLLDHNFETRDANGQHTKHHQFIPISFFEVPQSLVIVPIVRNNDGDLAKYTDQIRRKFWNNITTNQKITTDDDKQGKVQTRKYEVWNNMLFYERPKPASQVNQKTGFTIEAPCFRAIGVITPEPVACAAEGTCADEASKNILPSLLDKVELAYLTQYANQNATVPEDRGFTDQAFDIRETNGFLTTGLGVITHLKYYNVDKKPAGIDLIEYEHVIEQGRDIFVKVARLGYNTKTGQKYKHVIEAKRRNAHLETDLNSGNSPQEPTSFVELRQYCECIEKEISYTRFLDEPATADDADWNVELKKAAFEKPSIYKNRLLNGESTQPIVDNEIISPALDDINIAHYRRFPFTSITVEEKKRIPIKCLQNAVLESDICTLEQNALWFWPILDLDTIKKNDPDHSVALKDYAHCEFSAKDWEGKTATAATPFMFIRASVLEGYSTDKRYAIEMKAAHVNYFKGNIANGVVDYQVFFDRRKTYLNKQFIAFSPSLKEENAQEANPSRSKVNIVETDFIDTYFTFRKKAGTFKAQEMPYLILPQLLRFAGYSDHVNELTGKKIPQVMEYHKNYIYYKFLTSIPSDKSGNVGNFGALILGNTKAFIENTEEKVNRTSTELKNALQQSKNKLGNLVIPDIHPDTLSLEKLGITVPKDINTAIDKGRAVLRDVTDAQNALNRIASFNPREILRGKLSDVCGLDLTVILDELLPAGDANGANNQTPLFEINKALNKLQGEVLNSPIYKELINFKVDDFTGYGPPKPIAELIDQYTREVNNLTAQVEEKRTEINNKIKEIAGLIPNASELDSLIKNAFDQYRIKSFGFIEELKAFVNLNTLIDSSTIDGVVNFVDGEVQILRDELTGKIKEIEEIEAELKALKNNAILIAELPKHPALKLLVENFVNDTLTKIREELSGIYTKLLSPTALDTYLKKRVNLIMRTTTEVVSSRTTPLKFDKNTLALSLTVGENLVFLSNAKLSGYIQLQQKIVDFTLIATKNLAGTKEQQNLVKTVIAQLKNYQTEFDNLKNDIEEDLVLLEAHLNKVQLFANSFTARFKEGVEKGINAEAQAILLQINALSQHVKPYIDVVKKFDPYFYYTQAIEIIKQLRDIKAKFRAEFLDEFKKLESRLRTDFDSYQNRIDVYVKEVKLQNNQQLITKAREAYLDARKTMEAQVACYPELVISSLQANRFYKDAFNAYSTITNLRGQLPALEEKLNKYLEAHKKALEQQGKDLVKGLDQKLNDYIDKKELELREAGVDVQAIQNQIAEAKNIYRLITSLKKQELSYKWQTDKFRDINLGMVAFYKYANPETNLSVDVKAITHFSSGKFPPTIERVETYSYNKFSNFGIGFFKSITIGFSEVTFIAGSETGTHFDVKIKSVQFEGALSFVQAFQSYLKTLGKGLILELRPDHVALGYSLPIPAIQTPAFSFFNLSLNLDLRVFFDSRPLRFGFSLATAESKFGISAGIYAGFGFFSIVADPKKGIVEIDCALEAGAWSGIRFGPFSGEVKLAFGFRYTKNERGVRLEGYIVAEGRLSVWIFEISARIYLGVISENNYVYGQCTVTHSFKVGFTSKKFSGTYQKTIAGAKKNNNDDNSRKIIATISEIDGYLGAFARTVDFKNYVAKTLDTLDEEAETVDTDPVNKKQWSNFINIF